MDNTFSYFRIKMAYKGINKEGGISSIKTEDLVMATCYSEAEKVAYTLAEGKDKFGKVDIEIVRTKINEIAYNTTFTTDKELMCGLVSYYFEEDADTGVGLYQVQLVYHEESKGGNPITTSSCIYIPAYSSSEAIKNIHEYLRNVGEQREYTIRNVKYDKAQSVMVTMEQHQTNIRE